MMTILIFIISISIIYSRCKNIKISIVFSLGIMYLGRSVFVARAQQISFILFILEFLSIEKLLETNKKRYGVFLIIIGILLANLHSSVYPVYFILYLPHIAEYILSKLNIKWKYIQIEKRQNIKTLFVVFGISLFTGLCTTTGVAPYTDMIKAMLGISTSFIGELQNSTWYNNSAFYIILLAITLIIVFGKQKVKITDIFYIVGFGAMTVVAYRCFYFFLFIASISIARIFADFIKQNEIEIKNKYIKLIFYVSLIVFYLLLMIVSFLSMQGYKYVDESMYPVEASEYILENLDVENIKIYNGFNWGSYLEFKGIKAFIDSRSGMFCDEFNPGVTILEDWLEIYDEKADYNEIFNKYNITHVLVQYMENLHDQIDSDKLWNKIYEDKYFTLYEKSHE